MGLDPFQRTKQRPELQWNWARTWSKVEVNRQPVSSVLSSLFNTHNFTLPRIQLNRGTAYIGGSSRLRRVVKDMLLPQKKKDFKIAVIGGSVSWGQFASLRGETDWFAMLAKWMISAFPRANITARNGCTPGVPTPYMIMCLELSVDPDVDLVFMEYTLNDGTESQLFDNPVVVSTERLVRRVLNLPGKPAVVFMHIPTFGMAGYPIGHSKNPAADAYVEFYKTPEDAEGALSQYYDVQYLSLRTAVYRLTTHKQAAGFLWEDIFVDHHPGDHGHKIMADLAVHLIQKTAIGLLMEPYGPADAAVANEDLPPPMYTGNLPPEKPMCVIADSFKPFVNLTEGFEYIVEGTAIKPKPGFIATKPGSRLQIKVDTDRSGIGSQHSNELVNVHIHHLRSYEHMGKAQISCVSGCTCESIVVDATCEQKWSQVYLSKVAVTQAKECVIEVKVLKETSSGEHKFKVSGVVVAERPGAIDIFAERMGGHDREFGLQAHNGDELQVTITKAGRKGGFDEKYDKTGRRI
ncbi:hypothetical protein HYH03_007843 [Edaphochlamys debaryana]|uniref:SGNH hydrolase-type esterase domain-containing protein n=1 Tax=Edaphochlamys debaryana TaxID=47281 RepID=A0A835XZJ5_9CHLO|nr:hypothetical protein HYH03_007843 [Edaphochlamys debaryana]|eukprot:KAG2493907.1 hypothetical protein HYH03_007843 [Edaphochlamys debaryana]